MVVAFIVVYYQYEDMYGRKLYLRVEGYNVKFLKSSIVGGTLIIQLELYF